MWRLDGPVDEGDGGDCKLPSEPERGGKRKHLADTVIPPFHVMGKVTQLFKLGHYQWEGV